MKDITIIGGDGISRMLACCPDLADRHRASMHFLKRAAKAGPTGSLRIWNSRAAVAELKAACETIEDSLPDRNFIKVWERSNEKKALEADLLLKCIGKIRDLSLHTARRILLKKEFRYHLASSVGLTPKQSIEVFASPIIADGNTKTSGISSECIVWFNRQASIWPVEKLVVESWWRFACAIDSFMAATTQLGLTRHSTGPARKAAQSS